MTLGIVFEDFSKGMMLKAGMCVLRVPRWKSAGRRELGQITKRFLLSRHGPKTTSLRDKVHSLARIPFHDVVDVDPCISATGANIDRDSAVYELLIQLERYCGAINPRLFSALG